MDFDAEIDAALEALSDCSSEELEDVNNTTEEELFLSSENATEDSTDWMKLFLERTCEQSKKIEDGLCDAEIVLAEVNKTVNQCHSARLAITDGQSTSDVYPHICEDEHEASQSIETANDHSDEDKNSNDEISARKQTKVSPQNDKNETVDEFHFQKQEIDQRILSVETSYNEEIAHRIGDIEAKRIATEQHLQEMENAEREILMELVRQKAFYTEERNNNAACMIQSYYRRYVVRKQHGAILDERLRQLKETRTRARILAIEEERKKKKENVTEIKSIKETEKYRHNEETFLTSDDNEVASKEIANSEEDDVSDQVDFTEAEPAKDNMKSVSVANNFSDTSSSSENLTSADLELNGNNDIALETDTHSADNTGNVNSDAETVSVATVSLSPLQHANEEASFEIPNLKESQNSNAQSAECTSNNIFVKEASSSDVNMQKNDHSAEYVVEEPPKITSDLPKTIPVVSVKEEKQKIRFSALSRDLALLEKSVSFEKEHTPGASLDLSNVSSLLHEARSSSQNGDVRKLFRDDIEKDLALLEAPVEFPIKISTVESDCKSMEVNLVFSNNGPIEKQDDESSEEDSSSTDSNPIVPAASEGVHGNTCAMKHSSQDGIYNVANLGKPKANNFENRREAFVEDVDDSESSSNISFHQVKEKSLSQLYEKDELRSTLPTLEQDNSVEKVPEKGDQLDQNSFVEILSPSSINVGEISSTDFTVKKSTAPVEMQPPRIVGAASQVQSLVEMKKEVLRSLDVISTSTDDAPAVNIVQVSGSTTNTTNLLAENLTFRKDSEILTKTVQNSPTNKENAKLRDSNPPPVKRSNNFDLKKDSSSLPRGLQSKDVVMKSSMVDNGFDKAMHRNLLSDTDFDEKYTLTKTWKKWKNQCRKWNMGEANETAKPRLRRMIRKSSAAKKLLPLTQDEILNGKWPHYRVLSKAQNFESLSRVYIDHVEGDGRNLTLLHKCVNLTHLTLFNCRLVSLEGLQACPSLRHINVSSNNISFMSCDGMKRLESLVVAENKLTSIHGLNGCHALLLLDLSHNNITRISGLEETPNLAHLRLSHNQLLSVEGLKYVNALLSLDISNNNVSTLQGIEGCGLLRYLDLSNNYFTCIPASNLTNAVLLIYLDLGGNSISEIQFCAENVVFLPSLRQLCLQRNKISLEDMTFPSRAITPLLQNLNLSQNLISNTDNLFAELRQLKCFKHLRLSENLFSKKQELEAFEKVKNHDFTVSFSEEDILSSPSKIVRTIITCLLIPAETEKDTSISSSTEESYHRAIIEQINDYVDLLSVEITEVKSLLGWKNNRNEDNSSNVFKALQLPLNAFSCHCDYLKKHFEMAIRHRHAHEETPILKSTTVKSIEDRKEIPSALKRFSRHASATSTQSLNSPCEQRITEATTESNFTSGDSSALDSKTMKSSKSLCSAAIDRKEATSHLLQAELSNSTARHGDPDDLMSSANTKLVYEELQRSKISTTMEHMAARKIQTFWKRYREAKISRTRLKRHNHAASIIQSAWRGFKVRQDIKKAFASFNTSSELDVDDFEEVDLSQLEFDEDSYNQQWAFKTNVFRNVTPHAPARPLSTDGLKIDPRCTPSHSLSNRPGRNISTDEVVNSQSMWQKIASMNKPPLPPITPTGSTTGNHKLNVSDVAHDSSSLLDSHRSKHSRHEELLSNEWGLQSSSATELMLKRARRMKGRRKKEVGAVEKLRRFQDLSQKVTQQPLMTQQKPTQPKNRKEYFKAHEMEFEQHDKKPSEDDERRRQYTYEWLHTSANSPQTNVHPPKPRGRHASPRDTISNRSGSGKAGFLPDITQRHVSGSTRHNDMEVLSLSSYNSTQSRSTHLLKDIARRHAPDP